MKASLRQLIYNRDYYICAYCQMNGLEDFEKHWLMEVDHINPIGGDNIDNLIVACRICNSLKGKWYPTPEPKNLDDAIEQIRLYLKVRREDSIKIFENRKKELSSKQNIKL